MTVNVEGQVDGVWSCMDDECFSSALSSSSPYRDAGRASSCTAESCFISHTEQMRWAHGWVGLQQVRWKQ
jgi:hypothetical protein